MTRTPSVYEKQAIQELIAWQNPETNWWSQAAGKMEDMLHSASDQIRKIPGVDWTIDNVIAGVLTTINEIAQDLVWRDAIYKEFREAGHYHVDSHAAIQSLDLKHIDQCTNGLDTKYQSLAVVEGAATGFAGASGILPDIIGLVALNLRAAGEYATYHGYDLDKEEERLFALHILDAVSRSSRSLERGSASTAGKGVSERYARTKTVKTVKKLAVGGAMTPVVRSLATRLARVKLAQLLPVASAVVAGGFNAYYTGNVCEAAYYLYRERFLSDKYGSLHIG